MKMGGLARALSLWSRLRLWILMTQRALACASSWSLNRRLRTAWRDVTTCPTGRRSWQRFLSATFWGGPTLTP